jgi:hypothetical protein
MDRSELLCQSRGVVRSRIALLLSLPLSAAGMLLAHQLTWSVAPHEHPEQVAHGYLRYAAVFFALAAAVAAVAATRHLVQTVGGSTAEAPPALMFALIPMLGFVLQEHLEHLVAARELDTAFFLSAPFLIGLALQLPFAAAAMIVARLILRAIRRVAVAVREASIPRWVMPAVARSTRTPAPVYAPTRHLLAYYCAGRAPPVHP